MHVPSYDFEVDLVSLVDAETSRRGRAAAQLTSSATPSLALRQATRKA